MLRDRFVAGLNENSVQQHLLTIDGLKLEDAVHIAISREASVRDTIPTYRRSDPDGTNHVRKVQSGKKSNYKTENKNSNKNSNTPEGTPPSNCKSCGGNHWRQTCKFRNAKCFNCSGEGHISKVCSKNSTGNRSEKNYKNSRPNTNQVAERPERKPG